MNALITALCADLEKTEILNQRRHFANIFERLIVANKVL